MARSLEASKTALEKHRADGVNNRVLEQEKELKDLQSQLESNEQKLKTLADNLQSQTENAAENDELVQQTFQLDDETRRKLEAVDQEAAT